MGVNTGLVNMWCSFELLSRNTDDVSKKTAQLSNSRISMNCQLAGMRPHLSSSHKQA